MNLSYNFLVLFQQNQAILFNFFFFPYRYCDLFSYRLLWNTFDFWFQRYYMYDMANNTTGSYTFKYSLFRSAIHPGNSAVTSVRVVNSRIKWLLELLCILSPLFWPLLITTFFPRFIVWFMMLFLITFPKLLFVNLFWKKLFFMSC